MRDLLRVEDVTEFETRGGKTLYVVKGYTVEETPHILRVRTLNPWEASLCRENIGKRLVWVTYERALSAKSYLEYNMTRPPALDDSRFEHTDKAAS
jgi:hypothetical protein